MLTEIDGIELQPTKKLDDMNKENIRDFLT